VRTFSDHARNTLDLSIVPALQRVSHLPILVDPSHGTGRRDSVLPMARAGIAAGADGLIVEVHNHPETAVSDGPQSLFPAQFATMMNEIEQIAPIVGRNLPRGTAVLRERARL
jgi:3-deoxy-7-phosphoheptulonate synthase